jgi:NADH:ubiquinone oxidoreductase subunit
MLKNVFEMLFTWWNGKTLGTLLFTWRKGIFVGEDSFGNKYYKSENDEKRWVIYENESEASKIDPNWHSWIRFTVNKIPIKRANRYKWEKPYIQNLTGLSTVYKPHHLIVKKNAKRTLIETDYSSWEPR